MLHEVVVTSMRKAGCMIELLKLSNSIKFQQISHMQHVWEHEFMSNSQRSVSRSNGSMAEEPKVVKHHARKHTVTTQSHSKRGRLYANCRCACTCRSLNNFVIGAVRAPCRPVTRVRGHRWGSRREAPREKNGMRWEVLGGTCSSR